MTGEVFEQLEIIFASWGTYLENYSFLGSILREIGWILVNFLATVCDAMESVFDLALQVMTFSSSSMLGNWISDTFGSAVVPICSISLFVVGMYFVFSDKRPAVIRNVLVALAVVVMLPTLLNLGNEFLQAAKKDILNTGNGTMADTTIRSNVVDLAHLAKPEINFVENPEAINSIDAKNIRNIEINEVITKESNGISTDAVELFSYERKIDSSGAIAYEEIEEKGWLDIFDPPNYYRYGINFATIDLILLGNIVLILLSSLKTIQLLVEIIFSEIIAIVGSAEIASGAKTRKALEGILHAYLTLCCTMIAIRLYSMISEYMTAYFGKINLASGFFLFILAFVLADGPNVCEKIFGYDAGLSSVGRSLLLLGHGAGATKRIAQSGIDSARRIARSGASAAQRYRENRSASGKNESAGKRANFQSGSMPEPEKGGAAAQNGNPENEKKEGDNRSRKMYRNTEPPSPGKEGFPASRYSQPVTSDEKDNVSRGMRTQAGMKNQPSKPLSPEKENIPAGRYSQPAASTEKENVKASGRTQGRTGTKAPKTPSSENSGRKGFPQNGNVLSEDALYNDETDRVNGRIPSVEEMVGTPEPDSSNLLESPPEPSAQRSEEIKKTFGAQKSEDNATRKNHPLDTMGNATGRQERKNSSPRTSPRKFRTRYKKKGDPR